MSDPERRFEPRAYAGSVFDERKLEPMPPWLREVVDLVLPDLQHPRPIEIRLAYEPHEWLWVWEPAAGGRTGFWIPDDDRSRLGLTLRFADWLQDQFFPESRGAWGEARPECPGHPHPAIVTELN